MYSSYFSVFPPLHEGIFYTQALTTKRSELKILENGSSRFEILSTHPIRSNVKSTKATKRTPPLFNITYQTFQLPCRKKLTMFLFPSDRESYLKIYKEEPIEQNATDIDCPGILILPRGKFLSIQTNPFEPTTSCRNITAKIRINEEINVFSCDKRTLFHSHSNRVRVKVRFVVDTPAFSVTIAVRALNQNGATCLRISHVTKFSGTVTPYGFDGMSDYAKGVAAYGVLKPPPGHNVMLSFPHFNIKPFPACRADLLELRLGKKWGKTCWKHCGTLQLPPEVHKYNREFWFHYYTKIEKGYSGFKVRFSFHGASEVPEKTLSNNMISPLFNCTVPFYAMFRQHLVCNLETECINAEDEASCPYWQGGCSAGLLNAGGKCYEYVKTRKPMTWYDASSVCMKKGLTLASMSTLKDMTAFLDTILRFAPSTFKVFMGLQTSESSLPVMYREVWQWSNGIMAYYPSIKDEQLFKPTCGSFAALSRNKISTTMCGFYEYMHYIFCEKEISVMLATSSNITLPPITVTSISSLKNGTRFVKCVEGHLTYDFLSCDHMSQCGAELGAMSCLTYSSMKSEEYVEVVMYICDSQTQTIHYTQVCDHTAQCFDSSDESFCIHQSCLENQCLNQQCVTFAEWCDGKMHCSDGSDEVCPQFVTGSERPDSVSASGFHVVILDGFGKYSYIPQGKQYPVCPQTHFLCGHNELCLPVYLRCNDVYDCADREDEHACETVTCPGFYRCRQSSVCAHSDHICDGVSQCPQQDDELLCELVCPDNCVCQGLAFICPRSFPVHVYPDLRYLDSSGSGLIPVQPFHTHYLIRLAMARCGLSTLPVFEFPNLKYLYLNNNLLTTLNMSVFLKLSNLNTLRLSENPITQLFASESNVLLENFHSLDLSHITLSYFDSAILNSFRNLKSLNLSEGLLAVMSDNGFGSLTYIEFLDLRGTELKSYPVKMLQSLTSLKLCFTDTYKLCCQDVLPEHFSTQSCHTTPDEIASCKDLLRSEIYRMFLWVACFFALVGNTGSFSAKMYMQRGKKQNSFNVFIAHLNVSDFFMGLYLAVIGSADQVYRDTYLWHDIEWKTSAYCQTAGFFSLLSCEMSAFIICFITLDRFLVLRFPFSQMRIRNTSAQLVCVFSWIVGFTIAALPLLPATAHWEFYSQTDICIPLPVTKQSFKGRLYSFGILIVFNFVLFVAIAVGQMFIYMSIRANSMDTDQRNQREATVARRLLTVVMSDFTCWFPIGLCGLLASSGVSIPGEVNVAMAVFALPLNSALNPFLYTFNLLMEKRQKASEERLLQILKARYTTKA